MTDTLATPVNFGNQRWELPPLILHPFSDQAGPGKLLASSRASLMLSGVLPTGDASEDELQARLLDGRFCELRMLYFVGRDLTRWVEQCVEFVGRTESLATSGVTAQSFEHLLVNDAPEAVRTKLRAWGVMDYRSIFARALGLNAIFCSTPEVQHLAPDFIRHYYRYCDHVFACRQQIAPFTLITTENFYFNIFASGEYTRMLERAWGEA